MRSQLALLLLIGATPLAAQEPLAFLRKSTVPEDEALILYKEQPYRPIRPDEARAAGFLTEGRIFPFGRVLGPVSPAQVRSTSTAGIALTGTTIGIRPPEGASYAVGDTVVMAVVSQGPKGWGNIVVPSGLARVTSIGERQTLATVIATYGTIRDGQVTFALEPVADPGRVQPVKATGPTGSTIVGQTPRELEQPSGVIFIDLGRESGVRPGDFVEIRRRPTRRMNASDTIDEVMATGQILRVNDRSSTIKLLRIVAPGIEPGTPVVRVATLPN
jgi:hypothetical protein